MIVYKFSAKAVRRGHDPQARFVFLGGGSAAVWARGELVQSDLAYRAPDSHSEATGEPLPPKLRVSERELRHVEDNNIALPFTLEVVPR